MNPLLVELTDDQTELLTLVHDEFERNARWPIWQYVDLSLKPLGAAGQALQRLPQVRGLGGIRYGLVWWENSGLQVPTPDRHIALTAAGILRVQPESQLIGLWIKTLNYLVDRQAELEPSPNDVVTCAVRDAELRAHLFPDASPNDAELIERHMRQLRQLMQYEPCLGSSYIRHPAPPDGPWHVEVPATVVRYEGIEAAEGYVDRLAELLTPEPVSDTRRTSGLTLPKAISFLDAVWQVRTSRPLFVNLDADSVEKLTNPSELDSWTSALTDVLSRIDVPPDDSVQRRRRRPITVLNDWLRPRLLESSAARVDAAIDTLQRIIDIRVGGQHSVERRKAVKALEEFGLPYPPTDWQNTWLSLTEHAVGALEAIREEVQAGLSDAT